MPEPTLLRLGTVILALTYLAAAWGFFNGYL